MIPTPLSEVPRQHSARVHLRRHSRLCHLRLLPADAQAILAPLSRGTVSQQTQLLLPKQAHRWPHREKAPSSRCLLLWLVPRHNAQASPVYIEYVRVPGFLRGLIPFLCLSSHATGTAAQRRSLIVASGREDVHLQGSADELQDWHEGDISNCPRPRVNPLWFSPVVLCSQAQATAAPASQSLPDGRIVAGGSANVRNVTLCNSYDGIEMNLFSGCVVSDVYGTVLNRGIVAPESFEFSWMYRVRFSPDYWVQALTALGGRNRETAREQIAGSMRSRLVGLELGRIDALAIYDFSAAPAKLPVLIRKNGRVSQHRVHGFGGVVAKFPRHRVEHGWDPWYYGMHYANLDRVPEAQGKQYRFATVPRPTRTDADSFIDATKPPYSASGDGRGDDTQAIARALRDAGMHGGGTVYLRQGEYRISAPLVVPPGVELRGPYGAGRLRQFRETCSLAADVGHDSGSPERDPALLTLLDHAGVRGLTIVYPRQTYGVGNLMRYPYSIRGKGEGVWIVDVHLLNSCYGIDLATHRCDEHLVAGVWGTAFYKGIDVGGGSRNGKLERVAFSYGPWAEAGRVAHGRTDEATKAMAEFCKANNVHYSFGTCTGQTAWGLVGFFPRVHLHFYADGGQGCRDAEIWQSMLDVADFANVKVDAGERISLLGFFGTGGRDQQHNWIETAPEARGPVDVYAGTIEQKFLNHPHRFGREKVRFFGEASLTAGRSARTPDAHAGSSAKFAVDRDPRTVWEAPEGSRLQIDMGTERMIDRVGVETARLFSEQTSTKLAIKVQASRDGHSFSPVTTLRPGPWGWVDVPVTPVKARYLQLTATGSDDGIVRIATFDAWGPEE